MFQNLIIETVDYFLFLFETVVDNILLGVISLLKFHSL